MKDDLVNAVEFLLDKNPDEELINVINSKKTDKVLLILDAHYYWRCYRYDGKLMI